MIIYKHEWVTTMRMSNKKQCAIEKEDPLIVRLKKGLFITVNENTFLQFKI